MDTWVLLILREWQPSEILNNVLDIDKVAYRAFDPVFWMHHTNVSGETMLPTVCRILTTRQCDRIFALWQGTYDIASIETL
jgi:hypothetical protein